MPVRHGRPCRPHRPAARVVRRARPRAALARPDGEPVVGAGLGVHAPADAGRAGPAGPRGVAASLADPRRPGGREPAARRSAPGAGSATPDARCACTRRPARSSSGTAARCPPAYDDLLRAPRASATTPPPRSRPSRSAGATWCSTPTCAGCWPASLGGEELPAPSVTRAERDRAGGGAARGRAHRGHLVDRPDGAGRPGLHRPRTRLRRLPGQQRTAPGARPATRRTTGLRAARRRGTAPTGSAGDG